MTRKAPLLPSYPSDNGMCSDSHTRLVTPVTRAGVTTALWGWEFTQPQGAGQGASVTRRQESRLADSSAGDASDRVTHAPSCPHTSRCSLRPKTGPHRDSRAPGQGHCGWGEGWNPHFRTLHMPLIFQERQGVSDSLGVLL